MYHTLIPSMKKWCYRLVQKRFFELNKKEKSEVFFLKFLNKKVFFFRSKFIKVRFISPSTRFFPSENNYLHIIYYLHIIAILDEADHVLCLVMQRGQRCTHAWSHVTQVTDVDVGVLRNMIRSVEISQHSSVCAGLYSLDRVVSSCSFLSVVNMLIPI